MRTSTGELQRNLMASLSSLWGSSLDLELATPHPLTPPTPALASNTISVVLALPLSPHPVRSSTVHWTVPLSGPMPSCPSVFTFPTPGKLCRCGLRLVPYRHGAKQMPRKQGRKTGTAVSRHHIGSPCTSGTDRNRRILDGSGFHFLPRPRP